jgi:hypothetical protein
MPAVTHRRTHHAWAAMLLACASAMPSCGKLGEQFQDMLSLATAVQAKYNHPVNITVSTNGELTVVVTQMGAIDTVKFTRAACTDFAQDVARFAANHYARPATLSYVWVKIVAGRDYGPAHITEDYCTGGGPPASLAPDAETPAILKGAGTDVPPR